MTNLIQPAQLNEAGRVLSARNESEIRAAFNALQKVLNGALGAAPADGEDADEAVTEESMRTALRLVTEALSYNDIQRRLSDALRKLHPSVTNSGPYVWVRDVYPDTVVYEFEGSNLTATGVYQRNYAMNDAGAVSFGDPIEVMKRTEWVPVAAPITEASNSPLIGSIVPLVEKAVRRDNSISMKVIAPGWGSSGYYPADVLERDGPNVFKSGLHMYINHPSESEARDRPERSVTEIGGVLASDAIWQEDGADGPGLYADATVFGPFREVLDEIAPHIGVSIRASGMVAQGEAEGQSGPIVQSLLNAQSVDFVTVAGAGGGITSLVESARRRVAAPAATQEVPDMADATTLQEAQTQIGTLQEQVRRLSEAAILRDARDQVTRSLASTELHQLTRDRLTESLVRVAPVTDAGTLDTAAFQTAIDAAITEARTEYAAVVGAGGVRDMGGAPLGEAATLEESTAALDRAMARLGAPGTAQA